jgi:uracil-DNA glycosylase
MLKLNILKPVDETDTIIEVVGKRTPSSWKEVFEDASPELEDVSEILIEQEKLHGRFFPLKKDIFRAFELTPLKEVKVVLVGQDPYHQYADSGKPRAQGLSFSVSRDDTIPSSLRNIYTEMEKSLKDDEFNKTFRRPDHGDLSAWAKRGVLLLNMCLTVKPNEAGSHGKIWIGVIHKVLEAIMEKRPNTVFILLGREAQNLQKILGEKVSILKAPHPSGLSANRGFFDSGVFRQVNEVLVSKGEASIDWSL